MSSRGDISRETVRPPVSAKGLRAVLLRWELWVIFLTVLYAWLFLRFGLREGVIGFDFEGTLWDPALAIRDGRSPYPAPVVEQVEVGNPALYPPLLMLVAAPFTLLPWSVGLALWTAFLGLAMAATLVALGVRDFRCYLVGLLSLPVVSGLVFGNGTLLLVPLVALAWRWRDRWLRAGVVVGLAIGAKLFLWPLLVWLLATRRYRALGAAVVATGASLLVPWASIGFDGLRDYPDLLRVAEDVYAVHSYSFATFLSALGVGTELASRSTIALGGGVAAIALVVGLRKRDSACLSLAVLAAILGSPIVWHYYFALLLVPLAIARPRFSPLWAGFALFYVLELLPRSESVAGPPCCRPDDVPVQVWTFNHSPPGLWPALGFAVAAAALVAISVRATLRAGRRPPGVVGGNPAVR
jgi:arabinofuranan 3-O-arabinosyltransferase